MYYLTFSHLEYISVSIENNRLQGNLSDKSKVYFRKHLFAR